MGPDLNFHFEEIGTDHIRKTYMVCFLLQNISKKYKLNYFEQYNRFLTMLCSYHRIESFVQNESYLKFESKLYDKAKEKECQAEIVGVHVVQLPFFRYNVLKHQIFGQPGRVFMEYRKQAPEEGQERIGHTKWMVNHSKKEDLDKLMGMVPERTASVPDLLLPRLGEKNMSVEVMSELAGFNRATGYKIINGKQRAERDMLLRIAFVLEFTYEETAQLLKSGLRSALTSDSKRDVAIIYGLVNRLSLGEMDAVLEGYGLPRLVPIK